MRDNIEFDLPDGRKIGFRFGTYATSTACDKSNVKNIDEFYATILPSASDPDRKISQVNLLNLYWGAARQYADHMGLPDNFSVSQVSEWLEDIGFEKCQQVFTHFLKQYIPKKASAPNKGAGKNKKTSR